MNQNEIILEPRWLFDRKPRKVNRLVFNQRTINVIWLDRQAYQLLSGWAVLYGNYESVFSIDRGETWYPVLTEDRRMLLGPALPELTEREYEQLAAQGYYY